MTKKNAAFIFNQEQLAYKFSDTHPFNPTRLELTVDLLQTLGALPSEEMIAPRKAVDQEICLFHEKNYVEAVKKGGRGELPPGTADNYGLGTDDTPIFANMHEASSLLVGGTIQAVEEVMEGRYKHAANLGGGLHHGFRGKASGFCIYNDSAIAIQYLRKYYDARVLYIDTDAHHGDGVQWAFYDDPSVMTLSIHETGRYLFPGTGAITEKGTGAGYGYTLNIPLDAFTEDESFLECYKIAVEEACAFFQPDVIVTQNGADAHYLDPLTHLASTLHTFKMIPKLAHQMAHTYCEGRWVAVGGGGYDIWRVVPLAWSYVWLEMSGCSELAQGALPQEWRNHWMTKASDPLPEYWEERKDLVPCVPRRPEINEKNAQTLEKSLYYIQRELRYSHVRRS
ncbi:acetoin utilization protein AcuC [Geomicrobium halophilum]|uniref:Acetoin utilization protein AcuC n=1 Tax=Geomicrobium halophilum TaxID=549000 RepID=A0A841PVD3_9BACL|nr:acetoin utilization protein AcuC [Geomicrobium halophilum]MBB6448133.1 acetoin utilization protein AcuC [Geomicrobium halophilum]